MRAGDFDSKGALKLSAVFFFFPLRIDFFLTAICFFAVIQSEDDEKKIKE